MEPARPHRAAAFAPGCGLYLQPALKNRVRAVLAARQKKFVALVNRVILARIVGTVVSTRKDSRLEGKKLLIVKPISPQGADEAGYLVAVDTVDAGFRETVLIVSGSSARMAAECKDRPVDAAIIGIVDTVHLDAQHEAELASVRKR